MASGTGAASLRLCVVALKIDWPAAGEGETPDAPKLR
jgi:hypothetical protein